MLLTVTLNPALDRTMTVPNFQIGFRNRATDTVILPGGKGINVARAAKTLGRPVIATGFIGGRKGDQIVPTSTMRASCATSCGWRASRASPRRWSTPPPAWSPRSTSRAPTYSPRTWSDLHEKLDYLGKAADAVVFAGSVPPGLDDDCYAELIQHVHRLGIPSFFYTYADPLRLGIKAGADYVFPKLVEAEKVIGYEFAGHGGPAGGGAHHARDGSGFGGVKLPLRVRGAAGRGRGLPVPSSDKLPDLDMVSPLGWTDALIAGYAVHLLEGDSPEECLRFGLGCGAANLMTWGAGVFSPADAERFAKLVQLEEVSAEA